MIIGTIIITLRFSMNLIEIAIIYECSGNRIFASPRGPLTTVFPTTAFPTTGTFQRRRSNDGYYPTTEFQPRVFSTTVFSTTVFSTTVFSTTGPICVKLSPMHTYVAMQRAGKKICCNKKNLKLWITTPG